MVNVSFFPEPEWHMVIGGWEKLSVELFNWKTGILI
jgi:hypothetical protein